MVRQSVVDRRQGIRAKRILSIQYRLTKSRFKISDKKWHLSTTQDMSISGLSFLSDTSYAPRDILEIKVVMSGILEIYAGLVKVVRVERKKSAAFYLIGVKFVSSKTKNRRAKSFSSTGQNRLATSLKS